MIADSHINDIIRITENSFKEKIESFFHLIYPEIHLASHGLSHHRRVWEYAKEIILETRFIPLAINHLLLNKILFACYFHDIGMANDPGPRHGAISRLHCFEFLKINKLSAGEYKDALEAIEFHDDKEYTTATVSNQILSILSVADDLDAFGYTGIYRYSDIYLRRGLKPEEIGFMIRKNASARYHNFIQSKGFTEEYLERHSVRYKILDSFFEKYNDQLPGYTQGISCPSGYCGIIEIMASELSHGQDSDFSNILSNYSGDPVVKWYLNGLTAEMNRSMDYRQ